MNLEDHYYLIPVSRPYDNSPEVTDFRQWQQHKFMVLTKVHGKSKKANPSKKQIYQIIKFTKSANKQIPKATLTAYFH